MRNSVSSGRGQSGQLSLAARILLTGVAVVLAALGLLGLLLPVIPGIVLLALAAMVAAKCSPRIRDWLHAGHYGQHLLAWQHRLSALSVADYGRLAILYLAKTLLQGLAWLGRVARGQRQPPQRESDIYRRRADSIL